MKGELGIQREIIDSLLNQNMTNQKIEDMRNNCTEKDEELARLRNDLEAALNSLDNYNLIRPITGMSQLYWILICRENDQKC